MDAGAGGTPGRRDGMGRGQSVERQRPAIKPQSACFIFTVSKFINIDYILTIYNTFYTWRDWRAGVCCQQSRKRHVGEKGEEIRKWATGSKGLRREVKG